jgi:hypothetical protein
MGQPLAHAGNLGCLRQLHAIPDGCDSLPYGVFDLEDFLVGRIDHPQLFQLRQTFCEMVD